jgi:hypothetical protein
MSGSSKWELQWQTEPSWDETEALRNCEQRRTNSKKPRFGEWPQRNGPLPGAAVLCQCSSCGFNEMTVRNNRWAGRFTSEALDTGVERLGDLGGEWRVV